MKDNRTRHDMYTEETMTGSLRLKSRRTVASFVVGGEVGVFVAIAQASCVY